MGMRAAVRPRDNGTSRSQLYDEATITRRSGEVNKQPIATESLRSSAKKLFNLATQLGRKLLVARVTFLPLTSCA